MGFTVETHSLSALTPVKLTYKFNKEEKLSCNLNSFNDGLQYYEHQAFADFKDVVLSNKTCLILTDTKPLNSIFDSSAKQINIGTIAGCMFIKTPSNKYLTTTLDGIYVGGTGDKMFINVFPISGNIVELRIDKQKRVVIDQYYPYNARLSTEVLPQNQIHRQLFEVDYKNNLICFKTKTNDGERYLSYGADFVVRATGLMLNDTVVNPYLLKPEFISTSNIKYNFDAKNSEVKYFNDLYEPTNKTTVVIRESQESNTNLLVSCAISELAKSNEASVNIALTKSNFSPAGTYSTKKKT